MENIDKGHTVPKWVLMVRPKIPQMSQNLYMYSVWLPKFWISIKKGFIGHPYSVIVVFVLGYAFFGCINIQMEDFAMLF